MNVSALLADVKLDHVSRMSRIPIATLWRWKEKDAISGAADVQAFHLKRIQTAVRRLKRGEKPPKRGA